MSLYNFHLSWGGGGGGGSESPEKQEPTEEKAFGNYL